MRKLHPLWSAALAVWLAGMGTATAQLPATMVGQIVDENDEPVEGVTITITNPESSEFKEVFESRKRGRFKIFLANATVPYTFELSKPGYVTVTMNSVKIPARQETRRDFSITSEAAALAKQQALGQGQAPAQDAEDIAKGAAIEVYNKGVVALDAGDTASAKEAFLAALDRKPDMGAAYAALGRVYLDEEAYPQAVEAAQKALELNAEPTSMHQVLYASYTALGDKKKAQASLDAIKAADPEKAGKNMFNEAADLYNNGQIAEATTAFEQIIATDPNQPRAHYMLGLCYVNSGENAKAKAEFEKFIELDPNDPDAATAREMVQYLE